MKKTQQEKNKALIPTDAIDFKGDDILKALEWGVKHNKHVLLIGETGTGKTASIKALAQKHKRPYRRLSMESGTTSDDIIGRILLNAEGTYWIDGDLTDALRHGHWVLIDEVNATPPEVMFKLHPLLDDDAHLILNEHDGEVIKPHPDFRLFASMNPNYAGTRTLNRAFVSRFSFVVNYQHLVEKEEVKLLIERTGIKADIALSMVKVGNDMRQRYREGTISLPLSFRELEAWALLTEDFGYEQALALSVVNKCTQESDEDRDGIFTSLNLK